VGRNKRKLKVDDKVKYTIPEDIEREWTVSSLFPVVEGIMACLCRPDPEKKRGIDRCNADSAKCKLVKS
jgi:hypothetical protein